MTSPKDPGNHIISTYSDDYFFGGAAGYPNYLDYERILIQHGVYYSAILNRYFDKPGKVFDVGTAAGFVLKGMLESGWKGHGIEPNEQMAIYAREVLGLEVFTDTIESYETVNKYDAIMLIQMIAHFVNPRKALEIVRNLITNSGYVIVETWNWTSWTARIFGKHWHEYSPPSVLHWFSPQSLNRLMSLVGFELTATGRPLKRITGSHAKSLILHKLDGSSLYNSGKRLLRLLPDNITIPYPAGDLFWSVFKSKG